MSKPVGCRVLLAAAVPVPAGGIAEAQPRPYPVYDEHHLDRTMALVGRDLAGAGDSPAARDFQHRQGSVHTHARVARRLRHLLETQRKVSDAIGMLRGTIAITETGTYELKRGAVSREVAR